MKKGLLIFLLFVFCKTVISQPVNRSRSDSILRDIQHLISNIKTDTVQLPGMLNLRYSMIGDRYAELENEEQAMNFYRLAMTTDDFDYRMHKRRNFGKLAKYFLEKGQYDSILSYSGLIEKAKVRHVGCGNTIRYVMPEYKYWLMAGLAGEGMIDSAIRVYFPYAFDEWTNNEGTEMATEHLFENDYHCRMLHFLDILQKKYCFENIYKDVMALPDPVNIITGIANENGKSYKWIRWMLRIGEYQIPYFDWYFYEISEEQKEQMSKCLKNTFIYRYLSEQKARVDLSAYSSSLTP